MITETQLRLQTWVSGRLTQLGFNLEDIRFHPAAADGSIEAIVLGKRPDDLNADEGRVDFTRR